MSTNFFVIGLCTSKDLLLQDTNFSCYSYPKESLETGKIPCTLEVKGTRPSDWKETKNLLVEMKRFLQ